MKEKVSKAFVWFHASSYNGGAMAISTYMGFVSVGALISMMVLLPVFIILKLPSKLQI